MYLYDIAQSPDKTSLTQLMRVRMTSHTSEPRSFRLQEGAPYRGTGDPNKDFQVSVYRLALEGQNSEHTFMDSIQRSAETISPRPRCRERTLRWAKDALSLPREEARQVSLGGVFGSVA